MALKNKIQQAHQVKVTFEPNPLTKDISWLTNAVSNFLNPKIISPLAQGASDLIPANARQQVLAASDTVKPTLDKITQNIEKGFVKYGLDPKLAHDNAPYFAQAGQNLPDPYLPATQALKESSGGKTNQGQNNWFNIMNPDHTPVDYPDMKTALLGGGGHQGFAGIMHNGLYDKYLKSGKMEDFFSTYSPPSDNNPDMNTQIQQYNDLRSNFTGS